MTAYVRLSVMMLITLVISIKVCFAWSTVSNLTLTLQSTAVSYKGHMHYHLAMTGSDDGNMAEPNAIIDIEIFEVNTLKKTYEVSFAKPCTNPEKDSYFVISSPLQAGKQYTARAKAWSGAISDWVYSSGTNFYTVQVVMDSYWSSYPHPEGSNTEYNTTKPDITWTPYKGEWYKPQYLPTTNPSISVSQTASAPPGNSVVTWVIGECVPPWEDANARVVKVFIDDGFDDSDRYQDCGTQPTDILAREKP